MSTFSPGPGAYDRGDTTIGKSKGAKIGNEKRPYTAQVKDGGPGPGAYEQRNKTLNASISQNGAGNISKAQRMQGEKKDVPGPGMYDAHTQY